MGPAVGCVLWRSKDLLQSPSCSVCTSPSLPPALGTGPAAPTGPSTGPPTAAALDWLLQGPATPAAPAGRGPVGFPGPVKLQYASHHAGTEGTVPSRDAAAALQDGRETPARRGCLSVPADVDECSTGGAGCPQRCVNTAGSYSCQCWEGQSLSADGTLCLPKGGASRMAPDPTGADAVVQEEVRRLQSRVDALEQKLQLALAPLHSLASRASEHGFQDPGSLLAHSLQQLDRVDSLSEQVSFLEEQLGSCSCRKDL
ncbi:PREDICTED: epidermal growth factor-like protein 7 isoform X3 [Dipodomys ordii]|uniref:Epidermal growth factor-like protein 7 isoform X3 n=1 Tax=Dipodomys ordii TaxID=10020 RepID=A0A1S3G7V8_DIPOR|nr:PREDICTED: epidermal growth factor-like protein 7 isoform X3 [Dipodomys ordii]